jgi:hypothetical protein
MVNAPSVNTGTIAPIISSMDLFFLRFIVMYANPKVLIPQLFAMFLNMNCQKVLLRLININYMKLLKIVWLILALMWFVVWYLLGSFFGGRRWWFAWVVG